MTLLRRGCNGDIVAPVTPAHRSPSGSLPTGQRRSLKGVGTVRHRVGGAADATFRSLHSRNFRLFFFGQLV
ncbi:MAG: hypothetical protein OEY23_26105, partial [Acidimicrobiia bacterium]|nr:hypothetical protein [Acidimicrobiia bacterium]